MAVTDIKNMPVEAKKTATTAKPKAPKSGIRLYDHIVLGLGVFLMMGPLIVAFMTSTYDHVTIHREGMQVGWGGNFLETYKNVLYHPKHGK